MRQRLVGVCSASGPWLVLLFVGSAVLRPVLWSAFSADDTFDSLLPMNLKFSGESFWSFLNNVVTGWKTNEGRFFPVAVLVGGLSHLWFPERESYKIAQFLVALIVLMLLAAFVALLSRSKWTGILAGLLLLAASQMRVQYDPFLQFSLQQPALMTMVLSALILFLLSVRRESTTLLFASMLTFFAATLTYESSALLWPMFPAVALFERRRNVIRWVIPTAIGPSIAVMHLLYLRSQVSVTSAGYTSNFDIPVLLRTFLKQAGASIPMTYAELNAPPFMLGLSRHLRPTDTWWAVGVVLTAVLTLLCLTRLPKCSWRQIVALAAVGLTLWVLPALVVAQTSRWQSEIVTGNAYIPVYQGNIGFALVTVAAIIAMVNLLRPKRRTSWGLGLVLVIVLSLAVSSVITNNPRAVAQYDASFRYTRDLFTTSVKHGLFADYRATESVLTLNPDWWLTASTVNWYGGVRLGKFVTPQSAGDYAACIGNLEGCQSAFDLDLYLGTYGRYPAETRVVLVGRIERMTGRDGVIKGIRISAPRVFVSYPDSEPSSSEAESRMRCSAWFVSRMSAAGEAVDVTGIAVEKVTEKYCMLSTQSVVTLNPLRFSPS